jgi:hypothetical protein
VDKLSYRYLLESGQSMEGPLMRGPINRVKDVLHPVGFLEDMLLQTTFVEE